MLLPMSRCSVGDDGILVKENVANLRPIFPAAYCCYCCERLCPISVHHAGSVTWHCISVRRRRVNNVLPTIRAPDYKSSGAPANSQMGFDTHAYRVY